MADHEDSGREIGRVELLQAVATAASGYFAANPMAPEKVDDIIKLFFRSLSGASGSYLVAVERHPAVAIEESVYPDRIVCLDCGMDLKFMNRHLREVHGITPLDYRMRWGLPENYPMVASTISAVRKEASRIGREKYLASEKYARLKAEKEAKAKAKALAKKASKG